MVKYWKKPEVMKKKAEYIRERYASDPKYRKYMKKFNEEYYEENKDIMIKRARRRNNSMGEEYSEYQKQYYEENKDRMKAYQKRYQQKNKEKIAEYMRKYRAKKAKAST
jgi:hypothetical protein